MQKVLPAPPDESFIVLGSEEQLENLHRMLEEEYKG